MSDPAPAPLDDIAKALASANNVLSRSQNLLTASRWVAGFIALSILWIARVEWTQSQHTVAIERQGETLSVVQNDVSRIKGHLGVAANHHPAPPHEPTVVWSDEEKQAQELEETRTH